MTGGFEASVLAAVQRRLCLPQRETTSAVDGDLTRLLAD
jgi:hypothetical protein